jgi:hypothetical protein
MDRVIAHLQEQPGHELSSRDIGRHLQAMPRSPGGDDGSDGRDNALRMVKDAHGSLRAFLERHGKGKVVLTWVDEGGYSRGSRQGEFMVTLCADGAGGDGGLGGGTAVDSGSSSSNAGGSGVRAWVPSSSSGLGATAAAVTAAIDGDAKLSSP